MTEKKRTVIRMGLDRSTKRTHIYVGIDSAEVVDTIYINKAHLPKEPPRTLELSVEWEE